MKRIILTASFAMIGTFAFAANQPVKNKKVEKAVELIVGCSSTTTTVTTTKLDGTSSVNTTTVVNCDTPQELVTYHKLMKQNP
ncbi:hypothetical protein [Flavobacterium sp.]|uniref:hypothetical protein n=1 Tax=Flavobacterium sp. TaxID=239 RepID=UPI004033D45A